MATVSRRLLGLPIGLALFAAACAQPAAPQSGPAPAGQSEPKRGGTLTGLVASDPNDWDMRSQGKSGVNAQQHGLVYETLLRFKKGPDVEYASQVLEPRLAEKWDVSADGTTYTFTLRKGVKFHTIAPVNGRELTSADVKWSLSYYSAGDTLDGKKLASPVSGTDFMFEGLDTIETPDASTVRVKFKSPYAPFINYTASQWMPIAAKEVYEADGHLKNRLIGTGPFTFDEKASQKGTVWMLQKNPAYWQAEKVYLDTIRKVVISDVSTQQAAFRTKQLDVWTVTAHNVAQNVQAANPQAQLFTYTIPIGNALLLSQRKSPALQDVRVRRAISMAIDRQEQSKVMFGGDAKPFLAGSWPGLFTEQEMAALLPYDVNRAKQLLAEAGHAQGLTLEMIITDSDETAQHELLQSQLKKAGIEVKFTMLPREQHRPRLYRGDFDLYRNSGGGLLEADADSFLYGEFNSTSTLNWVGVNDSELDKLLRATREALEPAKRREAMRAAVKRINDQAWDPGIIYPAAWAFSQPYVRNWRTHFANGEHEAFAWLDK